MSSERQRPAGRDHVLLVERRLREGAAAVGVAGPKPLAADRPGGAAGRAGELPGATGDFPGLLQRQPEQAVVGLRENEVMSTVVLTRWMLPPGKTRSSRLTLSGSLGRFG